jgi:flagellar biogenesis protein FliO
MIEVLILAGALLLALVFSLVLAWMYSRMHEAVTKDFRI